MFSRRPWKFIFLFTGLVLSACSSGAFRKPDSEALRISLEPVGIDQKSARELLALVMERREVKVRIRQNPFRLLRAEYGPWVGGSSSVRVEIYDDHRDVLLRISGDPRGQAPLKVEESRDQPPPSQEELDDAIQVLKADPHFSPSQGKWRPVAAMPGVISLAPPGSRRRVITVGLIPVEADFKHQIVGVDLSRSEVIRFPGGSPPGTVATQRTCAPRSAEQAVSPRDLPGEAVLTVKRGDAVIWKMQITRPAASSGDRGSGIDLRNIEYQGKRVLSQLHVPILNVRYANDVCGPFRDWQYSEGAFVARGKELADGVLSAEQPPSTLFDSGRDQGNYRGVAVYADGADVVLVTELEAGWYRYRNEYRFNADGSIRPFWGFASVQDSCVCNLHRHHAYWRMDFELGDGKRNQIQVFDGNAWKPVETEERFYRDAAHQRWRVIDLATGRGYEVIPDPTDGTALRDSYAKGDVWALRFRRGEVDDSETHDETFANLNTFVDGQSIREADVVLWHAGHRVHSSDDFQANDNLSVGPLLRPVQWEK